jgi:hypothetical protein
MLLLHEASLAAPAAQRNDLVHLQLEVARRADELARAFASRRPSDRDLWLQSEQEIFARHLYQAKAVTPCGNSNHPLPHVGDLDARKTRELARQAEG